jgi:hypothetical protein
MSTTTKDPIALAKAALAAGKEALPDYSCPKSPHKFTQPQLFAMLVLRLFFGTDYRGLVALIDKWAELRQTLGLQTTPHYSTLCYAERRLLKKTPPEDFLTQQSPSLAAERSSPRRAQKPR